MTALRLRHFFALDTLAGCMYVMAFAAVFWTAAQPLILAAHLAPHEGAPVCACGCHQTPGPENSGARIGLPGRGPSHGAHDCGDCPVCKMLGALGVVRGIPPTDRADGMVKTAESRALKQLSPPVSPVFCFLPPSRAPPA